MGYRICAGAKVLGSRPFFEPFMGFPTAMELSVAFAHKHLMACTQMMMVAHLKAIITKPPSCGNQEMESNPLQDESLIQAWVSVSHLLQ